MPGIEDVQPKQLSTLGQPLVGGVVEPVSTPEAVQKMIEGFRSGYITTKDIMQRNDELTNAKQRAELQAAQEMISPESVAARKETARLAAEKAQMERETGLSKDFVSAYLRYNLPLKKADGTPDYTGMAEVGQKYADTERKLKYAELGMTGHPIQFIDDKGHTRTMTVNAFGEDITIVPGKKNAALELYQKMAREARSFILQNDKEPEVPKDGTPPVISVTPKHIEGTPTAPSVPAVEPFSYVPEGGAQAAPTVTPKVAPSAPVEKPVIAAPTESAYEPGTGLVTGAGEFKPDTFVNDARKTELLDAWNKKAGNIAGFRATVANYRAKPNRAITTQDDIALATDALILAAPGGTAGGRGMEGMRITRLEDTQPLLEQLYGIKGHILKEHVFEKGTRERLIEATERKAREMEKLAGGVIQQTADRLRDKGYDPDKFLYPAEKELLKTTPSGNVSGAPGGGGAVTGSITLGNRKFTGTFR